VRTTLTILYSVSLLAALQAARAPAALVELRGGTATFNASTNVGAISIHGTSKALTGRARLVEGTGELRLEQIEASVPVQSLNTGLGLRDSHMRKHVFTTPDGQLPDVRFTADQAACTPLDAASQASCQVAGTLAIRGQPRAFAMALQVKRQGDAFRAVGDGAIKLSEYGIERPTQFGVTVEDAVNVRLEFTATSRADTATSARGSR
jgi:polyisoprenoid-binding protein YceI